MNQIGMPEYVILVVLFFATIGVLLVLWPLARILRRMGFSPWFSLLYLIPIANLALLWVVAYSDWTNVQASSKG